MSSSVCRICLETDFSSRMISPCECRGTSQYVHYKCLNIWLNTRVTHTHSYRCEICNSSYKYINRNHTISIIETWKHKLNLLLGANIPFRSIIIGLAFGFAAINVYSLLLSGSLHVTIHSALLPDMDVLIWVKSDAYAIVCVDRDCMCETDTRDDTNNPNWNHECLNWRNKSIPVFSKLSFLVYDADHGNDDDLIGGVSLSIYSMIFNGYNGRDVILKWDKPYAGSLAIRIKWTPKFFMWFS